MIFGFPKNGKNANWRHYHAPDAKKVSKYEYLAMAKFEM